jgi:hypothetical protein
MAVTGTCDLILAVLSTKIDERALHDIEEKVGQSLSDGSTGLMGLDEFEIMYEVLQQYHPGFVYLRDPPYF